jgi:diamine N-acetyltransferase
MYVSFVGRKGAGMIIGDGIRFRAIERSDLHLFVNWLNDSEVCQYLTVYFPISMSFEDRWYDEQQKLAPEAQAMLMEVITEDGWKPIGNIGLISINNLDRDAELGIFIGEKSEWNKGYGRKALKLMLNYAFYTLNLNRVHLRVVSNNLRGIHSYQAVGFVEEGRLRQAKFSNGTYTDLLIMSVLRSEWQAEK